MTTRPYLPVATDYVDRDALKDVRDNALAAMADECAAWTVSMDWFRASLVTPAAHVLWRVLIADERTLVADALARVLVEIANRKSDARENAIPAPGEDSEHLDGGRLGASEDEHALDG